MDVNANEAFAILMREIRSPVDCLTEASVDHFESIVLKHLDKLQARVRELEVQLSNSIPKPVVEVRDAGEDAGELFINNESVFINFLPRVRVVAALIKDALGMEGGGDE